MRKNVKNMRGVKRRARTKHVLPSKGAAMMDYACTIEPRTPDLRPLAVMGAMLMVLAAGFIGTHFELTRRARPMGVASSTGLGLPVVGAALNLVNGFRLFGSDYQVRLTWPVPRSPGPWRASQNKQEPKPEQNVGSKSLVASVDHSVESASSSSSTGSVLRSILTYAGEPGRMLASVLGLGAAIALQRVKPGRLLNLNPIADAWSATRDGEGPRSVSPQLRRASLEKGAPAHAPTPAPGARLHRVDGVIRHSFLAAAKSAGLSLRLAGQVVKALQGSVDFRKLHPGDRFSVVYGHPGQDENKQSRVLAVRLSTGGKTHGAFWFASKGGDGASGSYFNQRGWSLGDGMLRAPLNYEYISSEFSYHRLDPVTHVVRPHYGVDYAAPTGTPVEAAADGRVIYRGHDQGGYGNLVIIKSFGRYKTYYAHLHRFASNVHAGDHVHEGEIIGYVGATGEATGPHLHFGVQVNGRWVNPRTYPLPHAVKVARAERSKFKERVAHLKMALAGVTDVRFAKK